MNYDTVKVKDLALIFTFRVH